MNSDVEDPLKHPSEIFEIDRPNRIIRDEIGLSDDSYYYGRGRLDRNARDQVESALLRTFGASSMYHAENVFIHSYILKKAEMQDAEVDWQTEQFIKSLNLTLRNDQNADSV